MWKNKGKQRQPITKKWYRYLGIICVLGIILASVVFLADSFQEKEKVSAHPTNSITLGSGNTEFVVPADATRLEEQALVDLAPRYDDYVQGDDWIPIIRKDYVSGFSSPQISEGKTISWGVHSVKRTEYGHYFVVFEAGGTNSGGLIKASVYDTSGHLLNTEKIGNLGNVDYRVTGLHNVNNNNYLIGTTQDKFVNCHVSNESDNSATITMNEVKTTGNATKESLNSHQVKKIETDSYSKDSYILGEIYPKEEQKKGVVDGRIPIGIIDTNGWLDISNNYHPNNEFVKSGEYQYSLENETYNDIGFANPEIAYISGNLRRNAQGKFYGVITYNGIPNVQRHIRPTFQIFDDTNIGNGNQLLKSKRYSYTENTNEIIMLEELCNNERVCFLSLEDQETKLIEVDLTTYNGSTIAVFPGNTRVRIVENADNTLSYYGSTTDLSNNTFFYSDYYSNQYPNTGNYFVSGLLTRSADRSLATQTVRVFQLSNSVEPKFASSVIDGNIFIAGRTKDISERFLDAHIVIDAEGNESNGDERSGWTAFVGQLTIGDDYSPVVSEMNSIIVDIDDPAIKTPTDTFENLGDPDPYRGWNTLDRWLITGTKEGLVDAGTAVKVYDHFDSNDVQLGNNAAEREEWLQKRINRNPKDISTAIEWDKLGFDATSAGPQLVTYFVTDTQNQASTTSRWVNKKTSQTIDHEEGYMLDAQNFHIPLAGIDTAIPQATAVEKFKELAKTMAWNTKNGTIHEDGTDPGNVSGMVSVSQTQLKALRNATVAKPYPVDVTYKPEAGVELTNRVWVFVTTKNTVPNSTTTPEVTPADTNGVVYYADDYSLPFRLRRQHDADDVLEMGNVRVYDYFDASHEDVAELPVLADKDTNNDHLNVVNLNFIQGANQPETIEYGVHAPKVPLVRYEWQGAVDGNHQAGADNPTLGGLDVTLTGDVLLHVRQVILDNSSELVVPTEGYLQMKSHIFDDQAFEFIEDQDELREAKIHSGLEIGDPSEELKFTTFAVNTEHLSGANAHMNYLEFVPIIPEFYDFAGCIETPAQGDPGGEAHRGALPNGNHTLMINKQGLDGIGEFFVTVFIRPTQTDQGDTKAPHPYSWDYKENNLGQIKTKEEEE